MKLSPILHGCRIGPQLSEINSISLRHPKKGILVSFFNWLTKKLVTGRGPKRQNKTEKDLVVTTGLMVVLRHSTDQACWTAILYYQKISLQLSQKLWVFVKNVIEHYLLIIKFCTKNVLYNFYIKCTVIKKKPVCVYWDTQWKGNFSGCSYTCECQSIQSWTKVSGQPRKNSITVQKEKTRRFIEKKHRVVWSTR